MANTTHDKRQFHRVASDAGVTVTSSSGIWTGTVQDVSLKGCLIRLAQPDRVAEWGSYHLAIHLSPTLTIEMEAVPAHQEGALIGFRCTQIDLDSITELRRLVELNLGDPALLERDLHALIHA
ncbi:MAG: PilZ domain-containing protein [Pseudomonadota bacterium]